MTQRVRGTHLAVIGAGAWGTTLGNLLAEQGWHVHLWVYEPKLAERIAQERENAPYLPGIPIHPRVQPTSDLVQVAQEATLFVSVVPSHAVRAVWRHLSPLLPPRACIISATKGIEAGSLLTMSGVLHEVIPPDKHVDLVALSGPTFAREVSQKIPTAVVAAAATQAVAQEAQVLFSSPVFRVYTSTDILGVELGGALKNVMALAAGVCDGLRFGYNVRAALITRGLAEISQLGVAMGAKAQTFAGLSGMGDLVLTCTGDLSRNHTVGVQLGQGKALPDILCHMRGVAEGVTTAASAIALGQKYGVEMPIAERVYAVLHGHIDPHTAVMELMTRALKPEDA